MPSRSNTGLEINDLCSRAQAGDRQAEAILLKHLTVSFRLIAQQRIWNQHDAEEIVQETLTTIQAKYKNIEFETSFASWSYRVLSNKIFDHIKKKGAQKRLIEKMSDRSDMTRSKPSDPGLRRRLVKCFRELSKVNNRHARILNLHYQGYDTGQICSKLGITENNFYVLLSRARAALEKCLNKEEGK